MQGSACSPNEKEFEKYKAKAREMNKKRAGKGDKKGTKQK